MTESPTPTSTPPMDIGSILRQARLAQGQSLDVIHQHTRIPKKFLEAIENNRFDEFPAAVYLRGFLKGYCEHLDIDFEPLWNQIAPQKPLAQSTDEAPPTPSAEARSDKARDSSHDSHDAPEPAFQFRALQTTLLPVFLLVLLFMGGAILWMVQKNKPISSPALSAPPPTPAAIAPIPVKGKMTLRIIFHRDAWVRLHCDGALRFEGRAPAGFTQEWTSQNDFILRTTTPDDIGLSLDGKEFKLTASLKEPSGDYKISRP